MNHPRSRHKPRNRANRRAGLCFETPKLPRAHLRLGRLDTLVSPVTSFVDLGFQLERDHVQRARHQPAEVPRRNLRSLPAGLLFDLGDERGPDLLAAGDLVGIADPSESLHPVIVATEHAEGMGGDWALGGPPENRDVAADLVDGLAPVAVAVADCP